MKTRKQYRKAALSALGGNWSGAVLCTALYFAIAMGLTTGANYIFDAIKAASMGLAWTVLAGLLLVYPLGTVGMTNAFKDFYRLSDNALTRNMFLYTFRGWLKGVLLVALVFLIVFAATFLFIVPGVICALAFTFAPLILRDNPQLSPIEALRLSRKMTKGHKMELFRLLLSFIGWAVLSLLTLGLGLLWLIPYVNTTVVAYYEDLNSAVQEPIGDIHYQD